MKKQVFDREDVLNAALSIMREKGYTAVTARAVAERTGCSVQPVYSMFEDMNGLMEALYGHALKWVTSYNHQHAPAAPNAFSSNGRAHLRLAQDEPHLFSFLYMSPYLKASTMGDLLSIAMQLGVTDEIMRRGNLDKATARELYLDMIVYTHGLASMLLAGAEFTNKELAARMDSAFQAFTSQAGALKKAAPSENE